MQVLRVLVWCSADKPLAMCSASLSSMSCNPGLRIFCEVFDKSMFSVDVFSYEWNDFEVS